jgi:phosphate transport system protein
MHMQLRREFDTELQSLKKQILTMGGTVEAMVADSITALVTRDSQMAEAVMHRDRDVDRMEMEIDELATRILALRQPTAGDLRVVISALKITTDLERTGDLSVNIAERVVELNQEPPIKPYIDIPRMVDLVRGMMSKALDCFMTGDADRAREVLVGDQEVDDLNAQVFRELLTYMLEDPRTIKRATASIFIAKYLERIADHATNVAEEVIFAAKGKDVRHGNVG